MYPPARVYNAILFWRRRLAALLLGGVPILLIVGCSNGSLWRAEPVGTVSPVELEVTPEALADARGRYFIPPRIRKPVLPAPQLTLNGEVKKYIRHFSRRDRGFISQGLERRAKHYEAVKEIFSDEGVPEQLINLAFIESGFNTKARSSAGALGMWQFMKSTARVYGLKVGLFTDQRKDPILSTIAAARHLRDLYLAFRDWNLALAAYNAGSGTVDRAVIRSKTTDFWTLARKGRLPKQTREFVPRFIAVSLIVRDLEKYGFVPEVAERGSAGAG